MTTTTVKPTVHQLRKQSGMTLKELAVATRLSTSGVHQVERGRYSGVNIDTATRIARQFELNVDDIDWMADVTTDGRPPLSGTPCNTGPIRLVETCGVCFTQKSASGDCAC